MAAHHLDYESALDDAIASESVHMATFKCTHRSSECALSHPHM